MVPVLVVDDSPGVLALARAMLERQGYAVVATVEHGGPALDQMRASAERLVVLLGLTMPVVDGEQVLEAVAADASLAARHRVVMMTADVERATRGRVAELRRQLGVSLVAKPFTSAQLMQAVEDAAASMV